MQEYMLIISHEDGDPVANWSPEELQTHVQKISAYIQALAEAGKIKGALPLEMSGVRITKNNGSFVDGPFNESKEVIGGVCHIQAKDLDEAVAIAKQDPRFDEGGWRIDVRPIRRIEGIN